MTEEELRVHVYIICASGGAKYCLAPEIELARNQSLTRAQLKAEENFIEDHYNEFKNAWKKILQQLRSPIYPPMVSGYDKW